MQADIEYMNGKIDDRNEYLSIVEDLIDRLDSKCRSNSIRILGLNLEKDET